MLLQCNVVNLRAYKMLFVSLGLYATSNPRHTMFPTAQFNSLFDHAKYTSNMAAKFSDATSPHVYFN